MQKVKKDKRKIINIRPLHTYLIKQYDLICDSFKVHLLAGTAEINGIQLMKYYPHTYTIPCSIPIFTWDGCQIQVDWKQEDGTKPSDDQWCDMTEFHSQETPMIKYLQFHYEMTTLRKLALSQSKRGPKIAILGAENSGSSAVTKLILNYTGKMNMKPIYVDLELKNSIFIDGTVGSMVFQYMICEDFFDRVQKISFFYGNRKIQRKSFLTQAKFLADSIEKKMHKQQKNYIEKGSTEYCPSFCSGLILNCPKILNKDDKKNQKQLILELLNIFQITHVLIVDNSELAMFLNKSNYVGQKYNLPKLEGAASFIQVPRPVKTKIQRYFQPELTKTITIEINKVHLYELREAQDKPPYCREIKIQQEPIAKSTISILFCKNELTESMQKKAERALLSPITCLAFIYRISKEQITLNVLNENFWEDCGQNLWMSMIHQHDQV